MSVQCIRLLGFSFFGIEIDAVGRLIISNLGASSAETAEHRGHPVEFIGPYLFDPDSDLDLDLDYHNPLMYSLIILIIYIKTADK